MNIKKLRMVIPVAFMFVLGGLAANAKTHKQLQGCTDSPESPTVVLGLVVAAAGFSFLHLRKRFEVRGDSNGS